MRTRQSRRPREAAKAAAAASSGRAPRLKLSLKASLPGRSSRAGQPKTHAYMQGFEDREMDSSDDETGEGMAFEEQLILRLPEGEVASRLKERVKRREIGAEGGEEVVMKFKDSRRAMFKVGKDMFSARLVDLPTLIESHKTLDNRRLFKVADISQMLLATHLIRDESEVTRQQQSHSEAPTPSVSSSLDEHAVGADFNIDDFIYPHGITPPMKWARKRRFRKRRKKRQTTETVEQEVQRLLAEDQKATQTSYEMVDAAEVDAELEDGSRPSGDHSKPTSAAVAGSVSLGADDSSAAGTPHPGYDEDGFDGASQMGDDDGEGTQVGEGSIMGDEEGDVDLDLQAELEAALGEDEEDDEDDDDEGSIATSRGRSRSRGITGGASEDEDLWDDAAGGDEDDEDDDDGGVQSRRAGDRDDDDGDDDEDDDDDDDDRVRVDQLEAECREIDSLVRRKQLEADGTHNALIKRRQLDALKRLTHERDVKRARLMALKEDRKRRKREDAEEEARVASSATAAQQNQQGEKDRELENLASAAAEVEMEENINDAVLDAKVKAAATDRDREEQETGGEGNVKPASAAKSKTAKPKKSAPTSAAMPASTSAASQGAAQSSMHLDVSGQQPAGEDDADADGEADDSGEEGGRTITEAAPSSDAGAMEVDADADGDEDAEGEEDDLWS
ncbi:unnamed protein product [Parajaminaea phylloscopi]